MAFEASRFIQKRPQMSAKEIKVYRVEFNSALGRYLVMGEKGLVAQCVYLNDANKICDALNADIAIQDLKADLERMVKMYGNKKSVNAMINGTGKDFEEIDGVFHGGKLAREIGDKWKIKYE